MFLLLLLIYSFKISNESFLPQNNGSEKVEQICVFDLGVYVLKGIIFFNNRHPIATKMFA